MYRGAKERTEKNGGEQAATLNQLNKNLASLLEKESKLLDAFLAEQITKDLYDRKVADNVEQHLGRRDNLVPFFIATAQE